MSTVLITGGTGLIGQQLTEKLVGRGHRVHILSRNPAADATENVQQFFWDPLEGELDISALNGVDGIVHLAGAGIADKRWTASRKKLIVASRVRSAELLAKEMRSTEADFDFFITASGSNYYGTKTSERVFKETDPAGDDFLAQCCVKWEGAAFGPNPARRSVAIRTAIVLSEKGGALEKIAAPIKYGLGAVLGRGKQYTPWIHLSDLVDIYVFAIENSKMSGAFNAVADEHLTQKELTYAIAVAYDKKIWLPNVPGFAMKLALGELSNVLLKGSRLSNDRVRQAGFQFSYSKIDSALQDLIRTP